MPELPEVETIRIGLSRLLPGKEIKGVWHDWPKSFPNSGQDVKQFLIDANVILVSRRGKALLIELDTKYSLVIHLRMTGQLVYVQRTALQPKVESRKLKAKPLTTNYELPTTKDEVRSEVVSEVERFGAGHPSDSLIGKLPDKSTRVVFDFTDNSKLFFNDQRKFGWVRLLPTVEVPNIDFFKTIGPEPLSSEFRAQNFRDRLQKRARTSIKAALLDQKVIAGVGNIYADESLWAAKIHPAAVVSTLPDSSLNKLYVEIRAVLHLSIEKGGSTDKNYVNAEGKKGSYLSFAKVFRREGQPCPRCGTTIIKTRVAGRGTHLCPKCQKETRP